MTVMVEHHTSLIAYVACTIGRVALGTQSSTDQTNQNLKIRFGEDLDATVASVAAFLTSSAIPLAVRPRSSISGVCISLNKEREAKRTKLLEYVFSLCVVHPGGNRNTPSALRLLCVRPARQPHSLVATSARTEGC